MKKLDVRKHETMRMGDSESRHEEEGERELKENKYLKYKEEKWKGTNFFHFESINLSSETARFNADHVQPSSGFNFSRGVDHAHVPHAADR
jgi:hypothetical protein